MKRAAILQTVSAMLMVALFMAGIIGSSRARVERDHSIELPASASSFVCRPFVSLSWLWDSWETATFSISKFDFDAVIGQFRDVKETSDGLRGVSRYGNVVAVSTKETHPGKLEVTIDTFWN